MTSNTVQTNNYYSIKQFIDQKGFIAEATLRKYIFHADENRLNEFNLFFNSNK